MLIICKLQLSKSFIISYSIPYAFSCPSLSEDIVCVPCDLEPTAEQQAELQSKKGVRSFMESEIIFKQCHENTKLRNGCV